MNVERAMVWEACDDLGSEAKPHPRPDFGLEAFAMGKKLQSRQSNEDKHGLAG